MAYLTYITEAIVCGGTHTNSSDRTYLLFTRDAGMIHAHAKSVREERSKQRYALQECSYVRVTLVRGKSGWRITGAEAIADLYARAETRDARILLRNLLMLVRRVIRGEGVSHQIFDDVVYVCTHTFSVPSRQIELLVTLRILSVLGYVPKHDAYDTLLTNDVSFESLEEYSVEMEKVLQNAITTALRESQL